MIFAIFAILGILISEAVSFYLHEKEEIFGLYEETESIIDASLNTQKNILRFLLKQLPFTVSVVLVVFHFNFLI
jgi:hypothetical protein